MLTIISTKISVFMFNSCARFSHARDTIISKAIITNSNAPEYKTGEAYNVTL
jgi:hypothetical protein